MRIFLLLGLLCLPTFSLETWPRFRGSDGAGLSNTKLPTKLGEETLFWSSPLPGQGSSSPVVWQDKLFITSENRDQKTISLVCLDSQSGKSLWTKSLKVGDYHLHRYNNTAASTPAVSKDRVVVSWFDGKAQAAMVSAFDHDGNHLWDYNLGPFKSQHGYCLNPVIHKNALIVAPLHMGDGFVATISLSEGKLLWKKIYSGKKTSYVTPLVLSHSRGTEIVVSSHSHGIWALDFITGEETWSLPESMNHRTIVSPINLLTEKGPDKLIGVGCKNGTYLAVRPPKKHQGQAEIVWRMKGKTPYVPTPVSHGRTVFSLSDGGTLTALEAKTGEVKWTKELRANFYASPLIANNILYALTREGELVIAYLDAGYVEVSRNSRNPSPETKFTDATPAIAHQKIYLRVGNRIDCHGSK